MKYIFAIVFSDKTEDTTKEILAQKCKIDSAKTVHQDSNTLQCHLDSLTVWNKGMCGISIKFLLLWIFIYYRFVLEPLFTIYYSSGM